MRAALIAAASLAAIAAPATQAAALPSSGEAAFQPPSPTPGMTVRVHRKGNGDDHDKDWKRDRWPRHPRHPGFYPTYVVADREYQGDSVWKHDSFNDWWHERPHRAYPRWMQNNQQCDRRWWGGGVWRC